MGLWKYTMKLIPVFLILLFFSGVLLLVYMTWTTFSRRNESVGYFGGAGNGINSEQEQLSEQGSIGGGDLTYRRLSPQLKMNEGFLPNGLSSVDEVALFGEDVMKGVDRLKMKVISNLRRHVLNGAKVVGHINQYGVNFTQLRPKMKPNAQAMMCRLKKMKLEILHERSSPVFAGKSFPSEPLFRDPASDGKAGSWDLGSKDEPIYRSCAVIPNSAALDGAKHGIDIGRSTPIELIRSVENPEIITDPDSHDFVLRFNNAPTEGYEADVGARTSMRIINSQVVTKPQFAFPQSSYFGPTTTGSDKASDSDESKQKSLDRLWASTKKFLIWDPCNYSSTVEKWYQKPDHPVFDKYFNLTSQPEKYGQNRFYIINCQALWTLWEILHEFTFAKIYGNPPTSGFIGIALALQKCDRVTVYEYIPSSRESVRCHYYGPKNESNPSCTYGSWHPVSAEKLFFLTLSDSSDKDIFMDGVLSIPGVSKFTC